MPLYEYKCRDCQNTFEILVGKTVPDVSPVCPKCGSDRYERLFSSFAMSSGKSSSAPSCGKSGACGHGGFS
ncbi:MAG: zinc ribbon domain-containing protein [candidate division Zixibacteria bacterium]|nr:zinc ribbon domain-containing protein [candidate division Zixibacteria bacterium]